MRECRKLGLMRYPSGLASAWPELSYVMLWSYNVRIYSQFISVAPTRISIQTVCGNYLDPRPVGRYHGATDHTVCSGYRAQPSLAR